VTRSEDTGRIAPVFHSLTKHHVDPLQAVCAAHLRTLTDGGHTQLQIARILGTKRSNFISMVMNLARADRLPAKRLPALARACALTPFECVRLFVLHVREYPEGGEPDEATTVWFMRMTILAVEQYKAGGHA
jgi:hypothetical protein